ncbi:recombinase family protein [Arthrobacter sp. H14]|uniref:recombinase family protein n=1 Tax=Arthrobacter sp. H14 TaxID=1312959 RepID=UPI0004AF89E8|nr:recombinase family protein [Arthrobacter sp. H14]
MLFPVDFGVEEKYIFIDHLSGAKQARERPAMKDLLKYARGGDEIIVWRIDRLGRSLIDVLNTVHEMTSRDIGLRSLIDGVDPSSAQGRLQLGLLATLAEYERELINERVRFGVQAAQARGVKFGQKPVDPETVADKVDAARNLLSKGKTGAQVAKAVGWSRSTLYRYLKEFGAETPPAEIITSPPKSSSRYADLKTLPARD